MAWQEQGHDPLLSYLAPYRHLIGDQRTWTTLCETVRGILSAGTLGCQRLAAHSPILAPLKQGAQRIIRLALGQSTHRSHLDADHLTAQVRASSLVRLQATLATQPTPAAPPELWLIADGSDLRKPYAQEMESLMQVRALDGHLVPGYRTLNVLGAMPSFRALLYHRLLSRHEPGFVSEPAEVQEALATVSQALAPLKGQVVVTWVVDRGFDDGALWRTIWEQQEHVLCRIFHTERLVTYQDQAGQWHKGNLAQAQARLCPLAVAATTWEVQRGAQLHPKQPPVQVQISACPLRLTDSTEVRRQGVGRPREQCVWLVAVRVPGTAWEPWRLLTDWPIADQASAVRVFRMDR
jgi:hypothetical protein